MNLAATTAGNLIATQVHVLTLHAPDGSTRCSFASQHPLEMAKILRSWEVYYLVDGYRAIEWWHGFPTRNYCRT